VRYKRCRSPLLQGWLSFATLGFLCAGLGLIEASCALREFYFVGWSKALIAGFVLKLALLATCIHVGEMCLYSKCVDRFACIRQPLKLWVQAHRMGRDIATSSLILGGLVPLVLLNAANNSLCKGCNVHQLLIYRNTGLQARDNVLLCRDESKKGRTDSGRSRGSRTPSSEARLSKSDAKLSTIFDQSVKRNEVVAESFPSRGRTKSEGKLLSIISQSVRECEATVDSFCDV